MAQKATVAAMIVFLQFGMFAVTTQAAKKDDRPQQNQDQRQDDKRMEQQQHQDQQRMEQQQRKDQQQHWKDQQWQARNDREWQERYDRQRWEYERHEREIIRYYWESDRQWNDRLWLENQRHEQNLISIETTIGALLLSLFGF